MSNHGSVTKDGRISPKPRRVQDLLESASNISGSKRLAPKRIIVDKDHADSSDTIVHHFYQKNYDLVPLGDTEPIGNGISFDVKPYTTNPPHHSKLPDPVCNDGPKSPSTQKTPPTPYSLPSGNSNITILPQPNNNAKPAPFLVQQPLEEVEPGDEQAPPVDSIQTAQLSVGKNDLQKRTLSDQLSRKKLGMIPLPLGHSGTTLNNKQSASNLSRVFSLDKTHELQNHWPEQQRTENPIIEDYFHPMAYEQNPQMHATQAFDTQNETTREQVLTLEANPQTRERKVECNDTSTLKSAIRRSNVNIDRRDISGTISVPPQQSSGTVGRERTSDVGSLPVMQPSIDVDRQLSRKAGTLPSKQSHIDNQGRQPTEVSSFPLQQPGAKFTRKQPHNVSSLPAQVPGTRSGSGFERQRSDTDPPKACDPGGGREVICKQFPCGREPSGGLDGGLCHITHVHVYITPERLGGSRSPHLQNEQNFRNAQARIARVGQQDGGNSEKKRSIRTRIQNGVHMIKAANKSKAIRKGRKANGAIPELIKHAKSHLVTMRGDSNSSTASLESRNMQVAKSEAITNGNLLFLDKQSNRNQHKQHKLVRQALYNKCNTTLPPNPVKQVSLKNLATSTVGCNGSTTRKANRSEDGAIESHLRREEWNRKMQEHATQGQQLVISLAKSYWELISPCFVPTSPLRQRVDAYKSTWADVWVVLLALIGGFISLAAAIRTSQGIAWVMRMMRTMLGI
ncbi:uncharacterized protein CTRU02_212174 [Colletotrichum truncatum]|uniref:Uncharacterized protein n=1 Tax=Colletotrichum truncatum TaxID=5467 RepID=A0ACC3YMT6_COLTU